MRSPFDSTGLARSLGLVALALSTTCTGIYIPSARVPLPASLVHKDAITTITVTAISTEGASVATLIADSNVSVPAAAITPISRRTRSRRPVTVVETVTGTTVMETITVTPAASSATGSVEDSNASSSFDSSGVPSISTVVVTDVIVVSHETVNIIYGQGASSTDAAAAPRDVASSASDVSSSSADTASPSIKVTTTVTVFPEVVSTSTVGVSSSTDEVSDSTSTDNAVFTQRTTITMAGATTTATDMEAATSVETSTSAQGTRTITIDTAALVTLPTTFVTLSRRADNKAAPSSSSSSAVWNPLFGHGPVVVSASTATLDAPKSLSTVFVKAKRTDDAAVSSSDSSSAAASASTSADAAPMSSTTSDRPLLTITKTSTSVMATVTVTVASTRTSTSVTPTVHVAPAAPTETRSTLQLAQDNCLVCQDIFDDNGIVPPEKVPASAAYAWKRSLDSLEEPLNNTASGPRISGANDDLAPFLIPPLSPTAGVPPVSEHAGATVTRSSFSPISLAPVTKNADSYTTRSTHSPIRLAPITNNADRATRPTQTATPIRLAPINNITTPTGVHQPQPTDLLQPNPFPKSSIFKTPAIKSANPIIGTPNPLLAKPTPTLTPVWEQKIPFKTLV